MAQAWTIGPLSAIWPQVTTPPGTGLGGIYRVGNHNVHVINNPAIGEAYAACLAAGIITSPGPFFLALFGGADFETNTPNSFYFVPVNQGTTLPPSPGEFYPSVPLNPGWRWETSSLYFDDPAEALAYIQNNQPGIQHTIFGKLAGAAEGDVGSTLGWITGNQQETNQGLANSIANTQSLANPSGMTGAKVRAIQTVENNNSQAWHIGELFNPLFGGPGGGFLLGLAGVGPAPSPWNGWGTNPAPNNWAFGGNNGNPGGGNIIKQTAPPYFFWIIGGILVVGILIVVLTHGK